MACFFAEGANLDSHWLQQIPVKKHWQNKLKLIKTSIEPPQTASAQQIIFVAIDLYVKLGFIGEAVIDIGYFVEPLLVRRRCTK